MAQRTETTETFTASQTRFAELVDFAAGEPAAGLDHSALEEQFTSRGRELLRQLYHCLLYTSDAADE